MANILTLEDNVETQLILKKILETKHQVYVCYDIATALDCIRTNKIDLILLDLMLPDGSGLSLFDKYSEKIPTIILSSLNDLETRISGLKQGADDYIIKPFENEELLARVESVLRRGPIRQSDSTLTLADVVINLSKQVASHKGNGTLDDLNFTPIELKILTNLSSQYGLKISRDNLRKSIWEKTFISERNVDTHICSLRKKLKTTQLEILNKRKQGYYLKIKDRAGNKFTSHAVLPAFGLNQ